jgi:hypothetical protein
MSKGSGSRTRKQEQNWLVVTAPLYSADDKGTGLEEEQEDPMGAAFSSGNYFSWVCCPGRWVGRGGDRASCWGCCRSTLVALPVWREIKGERVCRPTCFFTLLQVLLPRPQAAWQRLLGW